MATEACANIIDGKKIAKKIREEVAVEVSRMKEVIGVVPGLAVILVGDRKDSATYVRNKKKACENVGIKSFEVCLPEDSTEEEVLKHISGFNNEPAIHGILVQLPLPSVCFSIPLCIFLIESYYARDYSSNALITCFMYEFDCKRTSVHEIMEKLN